MKSNTGGAKNKAEKEHGEMAGEIAGEMAGETEKKAARESSLMLGWAYLEGAFKFGGPSKVYWEIIHYSNGLI